MYISEEMEKVLLLGIGAAATTAEKSKELLDTLVEKGELTIEQGKVVNEELKRKAKDKDSSLRKDLIHTIMERLTPEELEIIKSKLDDMENKKDGKSSKKEANE